MAYTMEDIRKSQEIFYYLLEKHELREEDEQALYKAYTEEEDIQNIVKSQAETASCDIERYGNTIYLIPQEENNLRKSCVNQQRQIKTIIWHSLLF